MLRGWVAERHADGSLVFVLITRAVRSIAATDIVSTTPDSSDPPSQLALPLAPRNDGDAATQPVDDPEVEIASRPAPGRVALALRADGSPIAIGNRTGSLHTVTWGRGGTTHTETPEVTSLCITPCTVFVRPGGLALGTVLYGTPMMLDLLVPPTGASVTLHSASMAGMLGGGGLAILGGGAAVAGGAVMAIVYAQSRYSSPPGDTLVAACATALISGVAVMIGGLVLVTYSSPRIARSERLTRGTQAGATRPWSLGAAPAPDGFVLVAGRAF